MSRAGGQAGQGGRGRRARDFTKPCPWGGRASVHAEALLPRALERESSLVWHTVCGHVSCAPPPQRESDIAKASRRGESSQQVLTSTLSQSSEDAWS